MKFSTYVALIATVSAQPAKEATAGPNPVKVVDGVAFEAFQREALKAGRDAKEVEHQAEELFN